MKTNQRVAILGGVRIPFAHQNTAYAETSNIEMLGAALKGLVERFGLQGESAWARVAAERQPGRAGRWSPCPALFLVETR